MERFFTNKFVIIGIALVLFTEIALLILSNTGVLEFKNELTISAFTVIPLFIIAITQLVYNSRLQKTDFVRDYAEEFFTNEALYSAFHELVYTYRDSDFEAVEKKIAALKESGELNDGTPRPVVVGVDRTIGKNSLKSNLYHPSYFQGSDEERRLDMLIGYFDLLGYHFDRGFVTIDDLAGSLGHYLNILSRRKVIECMRRAYREAIQDIRYSNANGRIRPFSYFDKLMKAIENHNTEIEASIKRELDIHDQ